MCAATTFNLQELEYYISEKCGDKEFFLGCWSPADHKFETTKVPEHFELQQGNNWIAIRNGADQTDGVLFPLNEQDGNEAIIFRGYLAEEALHSYSEASEVIDYWSGNLLKRHNGIFCAIRISENGARMSIVTDVFGMCPIYIRRIGGLVFFSSTPGLLSLEEDEPDKISVLMRLFNGYVPARNSLTEEIELASEASVTSFFKEECTVTPWYDYDDFPKETTLVNNDAYRLSEKKLEAAIERCQGIKFGEHILPLSSGYDSRRLFAHLNSSDHSFGICTVQTLLNSGDDVEVDCANQIARQYDIGCKTFELPTAPVWHRHNIQRLFSMDGQCQDHTWSVQIFEHYNKKNCCFFDGTGGDVFGFNDWVFQGHLDKATPKKLPKALKANSFPKIGQIRDVLKQWKSVVPAGDNMHMLAFALWQSRKSSAAWSLQQARPGQLILFPYYDLDYIEAMLLYANERYVVNRPQQAILYKFWPELAKYRGTREMPETANNLLKRRLENDSFTKQEMLAKLFDKDFENQKILPCLALSARILLYLMRLPWFRKMSFWWARPVLEMALWWQNKPHVIEVEKQS